MYVTVSKHVDTIGLSIGNKMYTKHFWMILGYPQTLGNFHWFKKANVPHILQATLVGTKLPLRVVQLWSQDPEKNTRRWRGETALHRWVRWCEMRDDADCIESQWRFHDLRIILIFKAKVWPVGVGILRLFAPPPVHVQVLMTMLLLLCEANRSDKEQSLAQSLLKS